VVIPRQLDRRAPAWQMPYPWRERDHAVWTDALCAPGTCVKWGGGVSDVDGSRVYREIDWDHCN
jgi:hypothetical protein